MPQPPRDLLGGVIGFLHHPNAAQPVFLVAPHDVLRPRGILAALTDDAMADNEPLFRTISRHLDQRMLDALAQGYRDGRLLFVGTANLDAQVPVTWNIGAIAASGHPGALDLIRRILLASAAIPGAFPPVMLDVTVAGRHYQEMHVDGGAFTQVFLSKEERDRVAVYAEPSNQQFMNKLENALRGASTQE